MKKHNSKNTPMRKQSSPVKSKTNKPIVKKPKNTPVEQISYIKESGKTKTHITGNSNNKEVMKLVHKEQVLTALPFIMTFLISVILLIFFKEDAFGIVAKLMLKVIP